MPAKKKPAARKPAPARKAVSRKPLRQAVARTSAKAKKPAVRKVGAKPKFNTGTADRPHSTEGMTLFRIDHLTIRAHQDDMVMLRDFYEGALGLKAGKRPNFQFPGFWMYMGDRAVIHLAGNAKADTPRSPSGSYMGFDHVSFRTTGLQAARERLRRMNVPFDEIPVPGFPLHQIFFRDPVGMKVELTFDVAELEAFPEGKCEATGSIHYRT
jgi:catechol 2,3-dioxygenase-like lactoylglutathione lyase family enzyme